MKLIVGLGNPGDKYKLNRHNVGFLFANYLLEALNMRLETSHFEVNKVSFKHDKYLLSEIARIPATNKLPELLLAKPLTFMNKSGEAVRKIVNHYKIQPSQSLIVIHDDLDIPFGKFKIQNQGPKQHNGLTDIQNKLQTMDFLRVRIGVDARPAENRMNGEAYVLQNFAPEELTQLPELFKRIYELACNNRLF
jgi:PTH1 family peptidyl-tRNA hydrolase